MRDVEVLRQRFTDFASDYAELPLYGRIAAGAADDADVAGLLSAARPGQGLPVLLLAAVHSLLLDGVEHPLGRFYPSVTGGDVPADDPFPAFRSFCGDHRDQLTALIATKATQTNEPNRSIAFATMVAAATADEPDRPVAVVELGASAGLNLLYDRYRLEVGDAIGGDPDSAVRLAARRAGALTPPIASRAPVAARVGIDREPVAVHDTGAVRWLEACLWPEQLERLTRFRAAVTLARTSPPNVVAGDMVDDLATVVAELPPDTHVVVFHSWALVYVERSRRDELVTAIDDIASTGRPVSWASAEHPGVVPGIDDPGPSTEEGTDTVLGLARWRGGVQVAAGAVGRCHPHLAWIEWL